MKGMYDITHTWRLKVVIDFFYSFILAVYEIPLVRV